MIKRVQAPAGPFVTGDRNAVSGLLGIYVTRIHPEAVSTILTQSGGAEISVELLAGRGFGSASLQFLRVPEMKKTNLLIASLTQSHLIIDR